MTPDFPREWANQHDGECEKRKVAQLNSNLTRSLLVKHDLVACHCYRRWLEARLTGPPPMDTRKDHGIREDTSMTPFLQTWANQHDGECEQEVLTTVLIRVWAQKSDYSVGIPFRRMATEAAEVIGLCHCYRRWLEARLGEMPTIEDIEAVIINSSPNPAILARAIHALLPPKGAGDE